MTRLLARLAVIEATGVLGIDVGWVTGHDQRILFHSVRIASAARIREMAAPRRHLALVFFLHQAWRDTLDQAIDMYGTLLDRHRTGVDDHLDDRRTAHRHAVDRIVHRDHRLGAGLLDQVVGLVSIRAPARGETRPNQAVDRPDKVSIRAPARGATRFTPSGGATRAICFNPRPRTGGDTPVVAGTGVAGLFQSAPPHGGRLAQLRGCVRGEHVSIRAPARGATCR